MYCGKLVLQRLGNWYSEDWDLVLWDWEICTLGNWYSRDLEIGTVGDWEIGTRGDWEIGTLGDWVIGTLGDWVIGTMGDWVIGTPVTEKLVKGLIAPIILWLARRGSDLSGCWRRLFCLSDFASLVCFSFVLFCLELFWFGCEGR